MATINSGQSVQWSAVPGAASYDVELRDAGDANPLTSFSVTAPAVSILASVLLAGRSYGAYHVRVRAIESAGAGTWSASLPLTFQGLPAPLNLQVV